LANFIHPVDFGNVGYLVGDNYALTLLQADAYFSALLALDVTFLYSYIYSQFDSFCSILNLTYCGILEVYLVNFFAAFVIISNFGFTDVLAQIPIFWWVCGIISSLCSQTNIILTLLDLSIYFFILLYFWAIAALFYFILFFNWLVALLSSAFFLICVPASFLVVQFIFLLHIVQELLTLFVFSFGVTLNISWSFFLNFSFEFLTAFFFTWVNWLGGLVAAAGWITFFLLITYPSKVIINSCVSVLYWLGGHCSWAVYYFTWFIGGLLEFGLDFFNIFIFLFNNSLIYGANVLVILLWIYETFFAITWVEIPLFYYYFGLLFFTFILIGGYNLIYKSAAYTNPKSLRFSASRVAEVSVFRQESLATTLSASFWFLHSERVLLSLIPSKISSDWSINGQPIKPVTGSTLLFRPRTSVARFNVVFLGGHSFLSLSVILKLWFYLTLYSFESSILGWIFPTTFEFNCFNFRQLIGKQFFQLAGQASYRFVYMSLRGYLYFVSLFFYRSDPDSSFVPSSQENTFHRLNAPSSLTIGGTYLPVHIFWQRYLRGLLTLPHFISNTWFESLYWFDEKFLLYLQTKTNSLANSSISGFNVNTPINVSVSLFGDFGAHRTFNSKFLQEIADSPLKFNSADMSTVKLLNHYFDRIYSVDARREFYMKWGWLPTTRYGWLTLGDRWERHFFYQRLFERYVQSWQWLLNSSDYLIKIKIFFRKNKIARFFWKYIFFFFSSVGEQFPALSWVWAWWWTWRRFSEAVGVVRAIFTFGVRNALAGANGFAQTGSTLKYSNDAFLWRFLQKNFSDRFVGFKYGLGRKSKNYIRRTSFRYPYISDNVEAGIFYVSIFFGSYYFIRIFIDESLWRFTYPLYYFGAGYGIRYLQKRFFLPPHETPHVWGPRDKWFIEQAVMRWYLGARLFEVRKHFIARRSLRPHRRRYIPFLDLWFRYNWFRKRVRHLVRGRDVLYLSHAYRIFEQLDDAILINDPVAFEHTNLNFKFSSLGTLSKNLFYWEQVRWMRRLKRRRRRKFYFKRPEKGGGKLATTHFAHISAGLEEERPEPARRRLFWIASSKYRRQSGDQFFKERREAIKGENPGRFKRWKWRRFFRLALRPEALTLSNLNFMSSDLYHAQLNSEFRVNLFLRRYNYYGRHIHAVWREGSDYPDTDDGEGKGVGLWSLDYTTRNAFFNEFYYQYWTANQSMEVAILANSKWELLKYFRKRRRRSKKSIKYVSTNFWHNLKNYRLIKDFTEDDEEFIQIGRIRDTDRRNTRLAFFFATLREEFNPFSPIAKFSQNELFSAVLNHVLFYRNDFFKWFVWPMELHLMAVSSTTFSVISRFFSQVIYSLYFFVSIFANFTLPGVVLFPVEYLLRIFLAGQFSNIGDYGRLNRLVAFKAGQGVFFCIFVFSELQVGFLVKLAHRTVSYPTSSTVLLSTRPLAWEPNLSAFSARHPRISSATPLTLWLVRISRN
jgi:hypothetical protein